MSGRMRLLEPGSLFGGPLFRTLLRDRLSITELQPGTLVGVFRIDREIARGGMGIVYSAERADGEYEQTVALKWLPDPAPNSTGAELFRHERQILANLKHPHIARLVDGGRAASGHLWFAMEYVDGLPVDQHVASRKLGVRARVALLVAVLDAVKFAHGRLLIHRDLKPSNVLIDNDGDPKLLDFGIAALLDDPEMPKAYSPGFASPEQLAGGEVGVSSDIWQLGRLCEIVLCAGDPPRDPGSLPSDLKAVIDKACADDPRDRYTTVAGMQVDLERFLAYRPVTARHGGVPHRLHLMVRRNPFAFAASAMVVVAFVAVVAAFAFKLAGQRDAAERAREVTETVNRFISRDLLSAADPWSGGNDSVLVSTVVEGAVEKVERRFANHPEVAGALDLELGRILNNLGRFDLAAATLERALPRLSRTRGPRHATTLEARFLRADVAQNAGDINLAELLFSRLRADAVPLGDRGLIERIDARLAWSLLQRGNFRGCRDAYSALRDSGGGQDEEIESEILSGLGLCEARLGLNDESLVHAEQALALRYRRLGKDHPLSLESELLLANVQLGMGRFDDAAATGMETYRKSRQRNGERHPTTLTIAHDLGISLVCAGKPEDGAEWLRRALEGRISVYGVKHLWVANTQALLAMALGQTGVEGEAERLLADAETTVQHDPVGDAFVHVSVLRSRGDLRLRQGRYEEAERDFRKSLAISNEIYDTRNPKLAQIRISLGLSLIHGPGRDEGFGLLRGAIEEVRRTPTCRSEQVQQAEAALARL
ncbi:serine/threonine-protein kinase [Tahibacter amnicola]|uniref:Serine/threonine-protein kinase n=1 Tax=Tahibacter amnicola TaxID=2976241 RepID=A0ABY6B9L6_9GAMM|nr:serine/threonine-protein kinase [Tahibacter amnicola]UXI66758.1 serine/threonine-protein kinase [Tahibacter amnicola]